MFDKELILPIHLYEKDLIRKRIQQISFLYQNVVFFSISEQ